MNILLWTFLFKFAAFKICYIYLCWNLLARIVILILINSNLFHKGALHYGMVESPQGEAKLGMKMSGSASASGIFTVLLKHLQNIDKSFQLYVVVIGNPHSYF